MRIFIALLFPETVKKTIYTYLKETEEIAVSGNFTLYNNLHLTLLYLGETSEDMLNKIKSVLSDINLDIFDYETNKIDFFSKNKSKKIIYLEVEKSFKLQQLYNHIAIKLKEINLNYPTEKYTPHITLGRQVSLISDDDTKLIKTQPLRILADRISIMESTRINGELTYVELTSIPLK